MNVKTPAAVLMASVLIQKAPIIASVPIHWSWMLQKKDAYDQLNLMVGVGVTCNSHILTEIRVVNGNGELKILWIF